MRDGLLGTEKWTKNDVLNYQRNKLGTLTVEEYSTCLLELFPLPRKTRGHRWVDIAHRRVLWCLSFVLQFKKFITQ